MQEGPEYYRCRNCGRYVKLDDIEKEQFCSLECARQYRCCTVCGTYFLPNTDTSYCSVECEKANVSTEEEE